jgi:large subunit ribosomal protein L24
MKRIKAGDMVVVISGDDKGQKGKVLAVTGTKVLVEGVNMMKKFVKKNALGKNQAGTIVDIERPLNISNVQVVDPKTGKGVKTTFIEKDGKKVRISRKSKEVIVAAPVEVEKSEPVKETKKAEKEVKTKVVKSKAKKDEAN